MFARPLSSGRDVMLADEIVFSIDGDPYRWRDVILAAVRWNTWRDAERRTRQAAAAVRDAEENGETLPAAQLDDAGSEFRYARDLVTAQSMEDWLQRRALSVHDWRSYLERSLFSARSPVHGSAANGFVAAEHHSLTEDDAARLTLVDAICSGELTRWSRTLAMHAAARSTSSSDSPSPGPSVAISLSALPPSLVRLLGADDATLRDATVRLDLVEASFERFRGAQVTERAVQEYVNTRQLDWVRFDCRVMAFPDQGMAAEAALLLREDDEGFTGLYSVAHAQPRAAQFFLDEIDASTRDRFLGARPGDLIGPLRIADEYVLYLVVKKHLPSAGDPQVRQRAEEGVLTHALDRQLDRRVRWHSGSHP